MPTQSASSTQQVDPNSPEAGYPRDNLKHVVITATCFAFILSTFSVGSRLISRKINGRGVYLDDIFILGALVCERPFYLVRSCLPTFNETGIQTHII